MDEVGAGKLSPCYSNAEILEMELIRAAKGAAEQQVVFCPWCVRNTGLCSKSGISVLSTRSSSIGEALTERDWVMVSRMSGIQYID